jgi:hypothetical protein
MVAILEGVARIIIYITKALFKALMIMILLFLLLSYTNVGVNINAIKETYYAMTGKELNPSSILMDLEKQKNESLNNLNQVSNMMNSSPQQK